ncbi:hypothetical protein K437DRAFT_28544 [Tilletiaria anomala UBC 951]|uniref:Uncharacterized protein n=1 Tax=Tilletiaria anomala (strain ATCC 24038 / CBS 436.72 / UBC 951) TaxID=1037660 RepID=A0A066VHR1_TILAU|nr:uncharacterized protein K437DRAFT_28544 [Tilletiaria anomala UBC 951]KDN38279.1 hypothetical protein K437DRAFT_28544 [Tilletiaria anomala UBC 951]
MRPRRIMLAAFQPLSTWAAGLCSIAVRYLYLSIRAPFGSRCFAMRGWYAVRCGAMRACQSATLMFCSCVEHERSCLQWMMGKARHDLFDHPSTPHSCPSIAAGVFCTIRKA